MISNKCRWVGYVLVLALLVTTTVNAAVPTTITHQGYLADSGGAKVNGPVEMTFAIYDVETVGSALWTESQTVQVTNGIYAVALGAVTPIDPAIIDGDLWLGLTVGTDSEMAPRQKLTSVAFALKAASISQNAITSSALAPGAVTTTALDDGAVTDAKIVGPVSIDKIAGYDSLQTTIAQLQAELVDLRARVSGGEGGYVLNGDGSVDDLATGLKWSGLLADTYDWNQAITTCEALDLSGVNGWRLPTWQELRELKNNHYPDPTIDPAFGFNASTRVWTLSESANSSYALYAQYVRTNDGIFSSPKNYLNQIMCVK